MTSAWEKGRSTALATGLQVLHLHTHSTFSLLSFSHSVAETTTLEQAEDEAFRRTCEHAEMKDGLTVLDLGCGWGSLTLWLAEHYPNANIHSLSNSKTQKEYIDAKCKEKGFNNVTVYTSDINDAELSVKFDLV